MPRRNYRNESQDSKNSQMENLKVEAKTVKPEAPKFPDPIEVKPRPKQRVFISLPMRGLSVEDIHDRMQELYKPLKENYILIDSIWPESPEAEGNPTWYLGKSIQALGTADMVVFAPDWEKAYGCRIERMACGLYGIPFIDTIPTDK